MDIQAILPDIFPHYVEMFGMHISQSLIAGVIGTGSFALLVLLYAYYTRHNTHNFFAQIVEVIYE
jgi:hypothetical protein